MCVRDDLPVARFRLVADMERLFSEGQSFAATHLEHEGLSLICKAHHATNLASVPEPRKGLMHSLQQQQSTPRALPQRKPTEDATNRGQNKWPHPGQSKWPHTTHTLA